MKTILVFLIFGLFSALVVGLIKPSMVLRWSKKPTRLKIIGWWFLCTIIVFFSIGLFVSDEVSEKSQTGITLPVKAQTGEKTNSKDNLSYEIITEKDNVNPEIDLNKCNIEVRLNKKLTKEELKIIANNLRGTRKSYDKLWIFYYLPEMKVGSGAWATTHFTPDLEVEILGSTIAEEKSAIEKINVIGNVIGTWSEEQYTSTKVVIYKEKEKIYIKTIYKNGQESVEELIAKKIKSGMKYEEAEGNPNGEYYVLENDGNLGYYNKQNNRFTIAKKN